MAAVGTAESTNWTGPRWGFPAASPVQLSVPGTTWPMETACAAGTAENGFDAGFGMSHANDVTSAPPASTEHPGMYSFSCEPTALNVALDVLMTSFWSGPPLVAGSEYVLEPAG